MYDTIIIGGGSAGISAAIYAWSRGLKVLLIEENKLGGLLNLISNVTHFIGANDKELGSNVALKMAEQLKTTDVEIKYEKVIEINLAGYFKVIKTEQGVYETKTVILATGTKQKEIETIKDNPLYAKVSSHNTYENKENVKDAEVFVVGGSDGAAKEALFISQYAKKVNMIVLEEKLGTIAQFKEPIMNSENIEVFTNSSIVDIKGNETLESVTIKNNTTQETKEFNVDAKSKIFVYIGGQTNEALLDQVKLENGFIVTDDNMETSVPLVYACGDSRAKKVKQIATAAADGAIAAISLAAKISQ